MFVRGNTLLILTSWRHMTPHPQAESVCHHFHGDSCPLGAAGNPFGGRGINRGKDPPQPVVGAHDAGIAFLLRRAKSGADVEPVCARHGAGGRRAPGYSPQCAHVLVPSETKGKGMMFQTFSFYVVVYFGRVGFSFLSHYKGGGGIVSCGL